jgi:glycosyltransferase involved in cell wall biosynthesis
MKKIFFVITTLNIGGAEKVLTIILNKLDRKIFMPSLVLLEKRGEFLKEIPPDIKIYDLKKKSGLNILFGFLSFLKSVFKLYMIIKKEMPDVVVGFLDHANLAVLLTKKLIRNKKICWIISERNLPLAQASSLKFAKVRILLIRLFYKTADKIIANTSHAKDELIKIFNIHPEKIVVIHNPIEIEKIYSLAKHNPNDLIRKNDEYVLISVGRLTKQKGYPFLLRAFADVLKKFKCRLIILGEGEEREQIEKLIKDLNLETNVVLMGSVGNPYPYIIKSDIFVMSSLWEGFPNALLEAMALGKPIIATKCNKDIESIVKDGKNGFLVPPGDVKSLRDAIIKLLQDKTLRNKFAAESKKAVLDFDYKFIVKNYENFFLMCYEEKNLSQGYKYKSKKFFLMK